MATCVTIDLSVVFTPIHMCRVSFDGIRRSNVLDIKPAFLVVSHPPGCWIAAERKQPQLNVRRVGDENGRAVERKATVR